MIPTGVFLLGPAGVGKTSLINELIKTTEDSGLACTGVNLDPGCLNVDFKCAFDARQIVRVGDILSNSKVGPNFAMVEAFNRIMKEREKIYNALEKIKDDIVYFDTPGQMEVFLFHPQISMFIDEIRKYIKPVGVFILDNSMVKNVIKLVVTELLSFSFEMHLSLPLVTVINKADLGIPSDTTKLITDTDYLIKKVKKENIGLEKDLILNIIPILRNIRGPTRVVYTSVKTDNGLVDLFNLINEVFCACGDIT
ncbi:MAG: ATP/GTP-binding protein [Candidatus Odinarchaeia archaeon]